MADVLSPAQRAYCMSRIRGRDTGPELRLRKALWQQGFRHRLKSRLPGRPDLVYSGLKTVIFVDGCFWHRCPVHYRPPTTRAAFWRDKIAANVERDRRNTALLEAQGWFVIRVWEHEINGALAACVTRLAAILAERKSIHLALSATTPYWKRQKVLIDQANA